MIEEKSKDYTKVKVKSFDNFILDAALFPVENPKAIVQIIHGALEHKERYIDLINYLNKNNYTVFISDNRGHGASIDENYNHGHIDGVEKVVDDNIAITNYLHDKYPEKEIYLIGHSLGTVFARIYLEKSDNKIKKLVLSGPPNYIKIVPIAIFIGNIVSFYFGEHNTLKILEKLYTGKKVDYNWLSYSENNVIEAKEDPLLLNVFTNRGYLSVFEGINEIGQIQKFNCKNKNMKILMIAGEDDVVIGGKKGFRESKEILEKIGYKNIRTKLYKNMKHEIFREENREKVFQDVVEFLENK